MQSGCWPSLLAGCFLGLTMAPSACGSLSKDAHLCSSPTAYDGHGAWCSGPEKHCAWDEALWYELRLPT